MRVSRSLILGNPLPIRISAFTRLFGRYAGEGREAASRRMPARRYRASTADTQVPIHPHRLLSAWRDRRSPSLTGISERRRLLLSGLAEYLRTIYSKRPQQQDALTHHGGVSST